MADWRKNSVIIQRGTGPASVYVGTQPRVGVQQGDPGVDPYSALLDQARQPFQVPGGGGQEYDYGALTQAESAYNQGMAGRMLPILEAQAKGDYQRGMVQANQTQADAQASETAYKQSPAGQKFVMDTIAAQNGQVAPNTPQAVAAQGQADVLKQLYGLAPGAAGPDGKLPPLEGFLRAMERQGKGPVQPGTPEHSAIMSSQYGPELEARLAGEPYGLLETPFFGSLIPEGGYRYQVLRDLARRNIGVRPGARGPVGVPAAPPPPSPVDWRGQLIRNGY